MGTHLHPIAIHMPLAISVLMPLIVAAGLYFGRPKHFGPRAFLLILGAAGVVFISGVLAYWTGEQDAFLSAADGVLIEAHRAAAKWFMLAAAIQLIIAIAFYFRPPKNRVLVAIILGVVAFALAMLSVWTGHLGGQLLSGVY